MAVKVHLILEISWDRDYWHCHRITIRPASKMVKKSEKPRGQPKSSVQMANGNLVRYWPEWLLSSFQAAGDNVPHLSAKEDSCQISKMLAREYTERNIVL